MGSAWPRTLPDTPAGRKLRQQRTSNSWILFGTAWGWCDDGQMRRPERGAAMVVTMIIIAALLAGAAVLASMQLKSSKGSEITRTGLSALACAESGIVAARPTVMANYGQWNGSLTSVTEPAWLAGV